MKNFVTIVVMVGNLLKKEGCECLFRRTLAYHDIEICTIVFIDTMVFNVVYLLMKCNVGVHKYNSCLIIPAVMLS